MNLFNKQLNSNVAVEDAVCTRTREQLSAYVDNTLSAREVWDVEKHLAACPDCAEVSRQMQATVLLLRDAERLDTGDDFMAKIHARLDGLEPEPARGRSLSDWMQDAATSLRENFTLRRAPGFGLGLGVAGVVALTVWTRLPAPVPNVPAATTGIVVSTPAPSAAPQGVHENLQRNVALTADDPLGDVAAAYLESADSGKDANSKDGSGS